MKIARNVLTSVLLIVLTAVGLINASTPGTSDYAEDCVAPTYVAEHHGLDDQFTCAFVRVSLGQFSTPTAMVPSGLIMLGLFCLPIMTVGAGLSARRQYRK